MLKHLSAQPFFNWSITLTVPAKARSKLWVMKIASTMREDRTYNRTLQSTSLNLQVQTLSGKAITLYICGLQHDMKYLRDKILAWLAIIAIRKHEMHTWLGSCDNTCGHMERRVQNLRARKHRKLCLVCFESRRYIWNIRNEQKTRVDCRILSGIVQRAKDPSPTSLRARED